jgi:hypothetical protein
MSFETASPGSVGVVGVFPTQIRPLEDNVATPSVNVPPISTAIRNCCGRIEDLFMEL